MNFTHILAAMIVMAVITPIQAAEDELVVSIVDRSQSSPVVIVINSLYDFEKEISVRVRKDPRFIPSEVLIQTVSEYQMKDANGILITSGYEIDVERDLIVGFSGGLTEIIDSSTTPQGVQVVSNFRDENGHFVSPPKSSIAIYNTSGDKLCFDYEDTQTASIDLSIALLLDRSGSMVNVMNEVKDAANSFLNLLPPSASCAVASFNTGWSYGHTGFLSCNSGNFGFENIAAEGGTDIYAPLKDVYQTFNQPEFDGHQKAAIIITDGYTLEDNIRKAELLRLKKDVITLVYFVGGNQRDELEGLTDHFIAQGGNVSQSINSYFQTVSQIYNSQKVLTVQDCVKP